jgi:protein-S-isoprenylcysteine O-methyltransferase Ste14
MGRFGRRQAVDLALRFMLGLTFAFSAGICFKTVLQSMQGIEMAQVQPDQIGRVLSAFAIGLYTLMIACLYVLRLKPVNRFAGMLPCAAAILGGFLMSGLLFLSPRDDLPLWAQIVACALVVIGNLFAVVIILRLGRSFSILPEGRRLVTSGPYRIIRHPLYLAEAVATLGAVINFLSPFALVLVAVQLILQLARIHYEERVLKETFPEYDEYARRTARLIPGIY